MFQCVNHHAVPLVTQGPVPAPGHTKLRHERNCRDSSCAPGGTRTPNLLIRSQMVTQSSWRYRWDLNPRWTFTHTTFRELHLRPLGHGTAYECIPGSAPDFTPHSEASPSGSVLSPTLVTCPNLPPRIVAMTVGGQHSSGSVGVGNAKPGAP